MRVEAFCFAKIYKVSVIRENQERMVGSLQPVSPLVQGCLYGEQLPIPHVIVGLSWHHEFSGEEGEWVYLSRVWLELALVGINFHNKWQPRIRMAEYGS